MQNLPSFQTFEEGYDHQKNFSRNILTRFEVAKLVGVRSEQLARGAQSTVDVSGLKNVREIAVKELKERKIPLMISRPLPNGKNEFWKIDENVIIDSQYL